MKNAQPTSHMTKTDVKDPKALRSAFGRYATGVTIVTASAANGAPVGITANSFSSVSLEPPLVLWSPAKSSGRHDVFVNAEHYAVHVLRHDQKAVCEAFVRGANSFDLLPSHVNQFGVPVLSDVLARFECRRYGLTDAGDHTLVLGEVLDCTIADGLPLTFFSGQYGAFNPE